MRRSTVSRSLEIGLRLIGMSPSLSYANLYWFGYMTTVVIAQYFQYAYIVKQFNRLDLTLLIDSLSVTLAYSLMFIKLTILWFNRRILYVILATINKDWSECASVMPDVSEMTRKAELSRRCSNFLICINAVAAFFYSVGGHVLRSMNRGDDAPRELPVKMEFPFEATISPVFELVVIAQSLHQVFAASVVAMMNALIVTLMFHISGQINIMCRNLLEISPVNSAHATMVRILVKHQKIIAFSDKIESLFSYIALMQVLWNTLVICCLGFLIVISIGTDEVLTMLTKSVIFYFAIFLEAFIFCFAGEYLSAKSKSIGDAAYGIQWYNMMPSECNMLLFIILRSQKRMTITAGKVMDLSLEGFTSMIKASASYISVLHAMY